MADKTLAERLAHLATLATWHAHIATLTEAAELARTVAEAEVVEVCLEITDDRGGACLSIGEYGDPGMEKLVGQRVRIVPERGEG